jgi:hypothetical protein
MQRRIDRALRQIELATTAAPKLLGDPVAMQRTAAQDRQQHPIHMSLNLAGRHT